MARIPGKSYSIDAYLESFDAAPDEPEFSFVGLVKPSEDGKALLYAHPMSCARWIPIPTALITGIQHLGSNACGDHRHALARITFGTPESAEHAAMLSLASLHHDAGHKQLGATSGTDLMCPPGQTACYNWDTKRWECCNQ